MLYAEVRRLQPTTRLAGIKQLLTIGVLRTAERRPGDSCSTKHFEGTGIYRGTVPVALGAPKPCADNLSSQSRKRKDDGVHPTQALRSIDIQTAQQRSAAS